MFRSFLVRGLCIVGVLAVSWSCTSASAQTCHMGPDPLLQAERKAEPTPFHAGVGLIFASYRNHFGAGNYQGLNALLSYQQPWLMLGASVAGYRLTRDNQQHVGVGDVALDVRGALFRDDNHGISLGLGLAAMLPTGSAEHGLGMGHTMLMPGAWFMWMHERFSLHADVSYGRALGGDSHGSHSSMDMDEHAHHAGHSVPAVHGSIVQPMNTSELTHALTLGLTLSPNLRLLGRIFGATPIAAQEGKVRELLALGAQGSFGRWDVGAEAQLPVVGSPFQARGLLTTGVAW